MVAFPDHWPIPQPRKAEVDPSTGRKPDAAILRAWSRRNEADAKYCAIPCSSENDEETVEETALRAFMDAQEELIRDAVATTARGATIQLLCSMLYGSDCGTTTLHDAILAEDLAALTSAEERFNWQTRMTLAALRSLKSMEATR